MKFLIVLSLALACHAGGIRRTSKREIDAEANAEILSAQVETHPDGSYSSLFKTSNKIAIEYSGALKKIAGTEDEALQVKGHIQFVSPDGTPMELNYIADENGYQPSAAHIPTPPPTPEAILRSLEYIKTHPKYEESKNKKY